ncbi:hypothetical protein [Empedobacter brevis]|uniref:hypothetical protein n=1 Tax=Empedobacter brevis TaxID=247 RepID=UPI00289C0513|nr:hypothetical protein [Empedobacter brevis]
MKFLSFIALFFSIHLMVFAKETIVKDFDGDGKFDKVSINFETKKIDFLLSGSNYEKQSSLAFDYLDQDAFIEETKRGFMIVNKIGDVLFTSYFKYNRQSKKLELSAIKRTIVSDDLSKENGESIYSVSTKEFVAKWSSLDKLSNKVITLPVLKTTIDLEPISLNDFSDAFLNKLNQQSLVFYKNEMSKLK